MRRRILGIRCTTVLLVLLASACASHKQVRCDGRLVPINASHPKAAPEAPK